MEIISACEGQEEGRHKTAEHRRFLGAVNTSYDTIMMNTSLYPHIYTKP